MEDLIYRESTNLRVNILLGSTSFWGHNFKWSKLSIGLFVLLMRLNENCFKMFYLYWP